MSVDFHALAFWGLAFEETYAAPWKSSQDPEPRNGWHWQERWQRRRPPHEADPGCVVGVHLNSDAPMYYVAIESSIRQGAYNQAQVVQAFEEREEWRRRLHDFCQAMDIPWKEPGWCLVTYMF